MVFEIKISLAIYYVIDLEHLTSYFKEIISIHGFKIIYGSDNNLGVEKLILTSNSKIDLQRFQEYHHPFH